MTITEAQTCKARGISRETITAQLVAAVYAQLRADELVVARAYALPAPVHRPAYASELCARPLVAYDYNGR